MKKVKAEVDTFLENKEAHAFPVEGVKHEEVNRYRFVNSSVDEAQNTSVARIDDINTPQYLRNSVILGSSKEIVASLSKPYHETPAVLLRPCTIRIVRKGPCIHMYGSVYIILRLRIFTIKRVLPMWEFNSSTKC